MKWPSYACFIKTDHFQLHWVLHCLGHAPKNDISREFFKKENLDSYSYLSKKPNLALACVFFIELTMTYIVDIPMRCIWREMNSFCAVFHSRIHWEFVIFHTDRSSMNCIFKESSGGPTSDFVSINGSQLTYLGKIGICMILYLANKHVYTFWSLANLRWTEMLKI